MAGAYASSVFSPNYTTFKYHYIELFTLQGGLITLSGKLSFLHPITRVFLSSSYKNIPFSALTILDNLCVNIFVKISGVSAEAIIILGSLGYSLLQASLSTF